MADGESAAGSGERGAGAESAVSVVEQDVGGGRGDCGAVVDVDEVGVAVFVDVRGVDGNGPVQCWDDGGLRELLAAGTCRDDCE